MIKAETVTKVASKLAFFSLLCMALGAVSTQAFAIPGCARKPPRTTNPNDNGPAGYCLGAGMRGCQAHCRSANACYQRQVPPLTAIPVPPAANPCSTEQQNLADCLDPLANNLIAPGTEMTVTLVSTGTLVGTGVNAGAVGVRCTLSSATESAQKYLSELRSQNSGFLVWDGNGTDEWNQKCEYYTAAAVSTYFGLPIDAVQNSTSLRRDLGLSENELESFALKFGEAHKLKIGADVIAGIDTVGGLADCVASINQELAARRG